MKPFPKEAEYYYYMSEYIMNLNHINEDLIKKIPFSDTRFRPDQKALELGMFDLASSEKLR